MTSPHSQAAELAGILDRFMERAKAARVKRNQEKAEKAYLKAIKSRFRAQAKWMLEEVLPQYRGTLLREALREAEGDPPPPSTAERLEALARILQQIKDYAGDDPDLVDQLNAALTLAYATGAHEITIDINPSAGLEISFGVDAPTAVQWLAEHTFANLAETLDATTADAIARILTEGLEAGQSYTELAAAIRDEFQGMTRARAELIAVTEIGNAYSEGTLAAARDLESRGITLQKAWLTVADDRVEAECEENETAGWIATNDDFPSGDQRPLAHPRCRCALLTRLAPAQVPEPVAP